jgi:DNA-binding NarL/FixJ family response regulator
MGETAAREGDLRVPVRSGSRPAPLEATRVCVTVSRPAFALGLRQIFESVGAVVDLCPSGPADVVVTDIALLSEVSGERSRVLLILDTTESSAGRPALMSGVRAICSPSECSEAFVQAVQAVRDGNLFIGGCLGSILLDTVRTPKWTAKSTLSPREAEVMGYLVSGKSNEEISGMMCVSVRTVKLHVSSILLKYGVRSRAAAVATATGFASGGISSSPLVPARRGRRED